jgi:hypothetical protein
VVEKVRPILEIHDLCKNFGDIRVVDELSFDVKRGEITTKELIRLDQVKKAYLGREHPSSRIYLKKKKSQKIDSRVGRINAQGNSRMIENREKCYKGY